MRSSCHSLTLTGRAVMEALAAFREMNAMETDSPESSVLASSSNAPLGSVMEAISA